MKTNHVAEQQRAIEEARQQLQGLPIAWNEFLQAAEVVLQGEPPVSARALKDAIVEAALVEYMKGTGYC